jgi:hypothetical protein
MLVPTSAALAMVETRAAHAGCTMDVECKGVRICESGRCVFPAAEAGRQGPSTAASAGTAATSAVSAMGPPQSTATPPSPAPATAAAPEGAAWGPRPVAPSAPRGGPTSRGFLVEVGGFGFQIDDGRSEAFGGGLEAGVPLSRRLAIAAWLEGSGQRQPGTLYGGTYRLFDVGLGLTVGRTVGPILADVSVLPELTWGTVEEGAQSPMPPGHHLWGAAVGARLRMGPVLRAWCPFIFVAGSYAVWAESYAAYYIHVFNGTLSLPPWNLSLGLGLAYRFGTASLD